MVCPAIILLAGAVGLNRDEILASVLYNFIVTAEAGREGNLNLRSASTRQ